MRGCRTKHAMFQAIRRCYEVSDRTRGVYVHCNGITQMRVGIKKTREYPYIRHSGNLFNGGNNSIGDNYPDISFFKIISQKCLSLKYLFRVQ